MDIKAKIGARIKEIRTQKNVTQESVAYATDINRTYMNHVENGKRNVSIVNLEKIICALEMSLKDFFDSKIFVE